MQGQLDGKEDAFLARSGELRKSLDLGSGDMYLEIDPAFATTLSSSSVSARTNAGLLLRGDGGQNAMLVVGSSGAEGSVLFYKDVALFTGASLSLMQGDLTVSNGDLTVGGDLQGAASTGLFLKSDGGVSAIKISGSSEGASEGSVRLYQSLVVVGNVTLGSGSRVTSGLYHVAGLFNGASMTISKQKGDYTFSIARASGHPAGVWDITWATAHPDGASYVPFATSNEYMQSIYARTSTSFQIFCRDESGVLQDANVSFAVLK